LSRVLAVDPGAARVGLALSDENARLATPLVTLTGDAATAQGIADLARENAAGTIVVGLPRRLDGGEGAEATRARELAAQLAVLSEVPVVLWDERLTSVMAERAMQATGSHRAPRRRQGARVARGLVTARREAVDRAAAAILLQSYLDRRVD
jgi:putative Holliday junction resolvase